MITKLANKREVTTKNNKTYTKRPKIQRLITPLRLRRKRIVKKLKEENAKFTAEQKKNYDTLFKNKNKKGGKSKNKKN